MAKTRRVALNNETAFRFAADDFGVEVEEVEAKEVAEPEVEDVTAAPVTDDEM